MDDVKGEVKDAGSSPKFGIYRLVKMHIWNAVCTLHNMRFLQHTDLACRGDTKSALSSFFHPTTSTPYPTIELTFVQSYAPIITL